MKIKQTRQVRLDELLKYVWDSGIKSESFFAKESEGHINVDSDGDFCMYGRPHVNKDERFTITEEVEITEDTVIDLAYRIETEKGWKTFDKHGVTINKIIDTYKKHHHVYLGFIYLLNSDGSIGELIWKDGGLVE